MYAPILLLTLLAATTALALPTITNTITNTTTTLLQERNEHYPWVGTYPPSDPTCAGPFHSNGVRERPEIDVSGDCMPFTRAPKSSAWIYWGTTPLNVNTVHFFYDDKCQDYAHNVPKAHAGDAYSCVQFEEDDKPWGSVSGEWDYNLGSLQGQS